MIKSLSRVFYFNLIFVLMFFNLSCGNNISKQDKVRDKGNISKLAFKSQKERLDTDKKENPDKIKLSDDQKRYCDKDAALWHAIMANGSKIGHLSYSRTVEDSVVITCENSIMVMSRAGVSLSLNTVLITRESVKGKPVSFKMKISGSGMNQILEGEVKGAKLLLNSTVSGESTHKTLTLAPNTFFTEGRRLKLIEKTKDLDSFTINGFDQVSGRMVKYTFKKIKDNSELLHNGKILEKMKVTERSLDGEVSSFEWFDKDMYVYKTKSKLAGLIFETVITTKKSALSKSSKMLPFDIFRQTQIFSPVSLGKKRRAGRLRYKISASDNNELSADRLNFVNSIEQQVSIIENNDKKQYVVNVSIAKIPHVEIGCKSKEPDILKYLKPNEWVQSDNKAIVNLAKKTLAGAGDIADAAHIIESFVSLYISSPGLSTAYGTALDVLKNREGDCSEYAIFTAALFRAAGIPARVVFGMVYVSGDAGSKNEYFTGHAWTQIYAKGKWYSVDSALNGFDAGHLAISVSTGDPAALYQSISTIGEFEIDTIE